MKLTEGRKIGDKGVPRALTPEEARKAAYRLANQMVTQGAIDLGSFSRRDLTDAISQL